MRIFGLTGNTGSGKSTVAKMLGDEGVAVVDADQLARDVVAPGTPALEAIRKTFGEDFITQQGELKRKELARVVFSSREALAKLEAITHPQIAAKAAELFAKASVLGTELGVYDSAILVESGQANSFAGLIVVATSRDLQIQRIIARDGLSQQDAILRIDAQLSQETKIEQADYVVRNDGTLLDLASEIPALLSWMAT